MATAAKKPQPVKSDVNKWLQKDRKVWVKSLPGYPNPNEDAFLQGKVTQIGDKQVTLILSDSQKIIKAPLQNVLKLTYGPHDVADMVDLQELNQPELLFNIKRRYVADQIFTYCGPTLVIINPYCYIDKQFNDGLLQQYQTMVFTDSLQYKTLPPHVFALAAFCLWQLFQNEKNQSIVISGESGAGKSQNTKYCLKFLASLGKNMTSLANEPSQKTLQISSSSRSVKINYQNIKQIGKAAKKGNSKVFGMQEKILGCNEILEAFGNSKTIRNDNSSRFGKLVLLIYGQTKIDIKSAFIITYLLEKSRIVSISDGQRNYHIFYFFCKGTTTQQKKLYKLTQPINKYYYLNQSTVYDIPKGGDQQSFLMIKKQFSMYLSPEQTDCVLRVISIVLNVGNLVFEKGQNKNNQQIAIITNQEFLKNVSELLQLDYPKLKHCFQFRAIKTRQGISYSPWRFDQAIALRDSFAKNIYEKIFNFLVVRLNQKIEIEKIDLTSGSNQYRKSIGLLDIFGFEVLIVNSLQQFFINFANEKLQQLYVSYIFKQQQNQFIKQGLKQFSQDIGFQDNKPVIDLFQSYPLGIFHLINESSQLNKPDQNLPETIIKNHGKLPFVSIPKGKRGYFQIDHSCSSVNYFALGFTTKNKDQFPKQLLQLINTTKNQTFKSIIVNQKQQQQPKGKKGASKFLGIKFLSQMNKLTEELYSCDCHFVRCIKPNTQKKPRLFNSQMVLQSLRYLGVLDSIKIRKLGYIYRRPYKQFYKKFYQMQKYGFSFKADVEGKTEDDFRDQTKRIIQKFCKKQLEDNHILLGAKKIMIKQAVVNNLQHLTKQKRRQRIQVANRIRTIFKKSKYRREVKSVNKSIMILKYYMLDLARWARKKVLQKKARSIQYVIKQYLWFIRLQRIKEAATKSVTKIGAYFKMKKQRRLYLQARVNIKKFQAKIRAFNSMRQYVKQINVANVIKTIFNRCWRIIQLKSALLIQKHFRGFRIRRQLKEFLRRIKMKAFIKRTIQKWRVTQMLKFLELHRKPIIKLQSFVKARYMRRVFLKTKNAALLIQKAYRAHLYRKYYLTRAWSKYRDKLYLMQKEKLNQLSKLGFQRKGPSTLKIPPNETSSLVQKVSATQVGLNQKMPQQSADIRINETIAFAEKNTIQCYIMDIDFLSIVSYKGKWMQYYAQMKSFLARKQQYPLKIDISQNSTYVVSNKDRVYSFDKDQLSIEQMEEEQFQKYEKVQIRSIPHSICINQNSIYLITKEYQLYQWGCNKNGQLFIESTQKDVILNYVSSVPSAKQVEARGTNRYYADQQGKLYTKIDNSIKLVNINQKAQVNSIVASYNFVHFLTITGQIYSLGSNKYGQLGIDNKSKTITQPTLNQFLANKKQMIESVSVGLNHTVARSKLGYVYSWGDNRSGQVYYSTSQYIRYPVQLQFQKQKLKVLQAVAGLRATYLLTQSFTILGLGASNTFDTSKSLNFCQIDLLHSTNSNPKNLVPLKLSCTWNRQMSVLIGNCLQQNKCKPGTKPDVILKYCKVIAKDWSQKLIYPQYNEWMDNILNIGDMRKFRFQKNLKSTKSKQNGPTNNKMPDSEIDELKALMDLRKTSNLFKSAAKNKIQQIIKRLSLKPTQQWTKQDQQINNYIKEYCKVALK